MKACMTGSSNGGLTAELNSRLMPLYVEFACAVYARASREYNLQSLYNTYSKANPAEVHKDTKAALLKLCTGDLSSIRRRTICVDATSGPVPGSSGCTVWDFLPLQCNEDWAWGPQPFAFLRGPSGGLVAEEMVPYSNVDNPLIPPQRCVAVCDC